MKSRYLLFYTSQLNKIFLSILSNKMSVLRAGLHNQGLRKQHNEKHQLCNNKNTPRGVLLKSCQRQLKVIARAGGDFNYVMLVSQDLGLDLLKLPTVNQNKGFIIPTFCRPSADFEVVEDRLGSRYTPTSIRLFVYTQMTRSIASGALIITGYFIKV